MVTKDLQSILKNTKKATGSNPTSDALIQEKTEGRIQSAVDRGDFTNLAGEGKPLVLDKNPFTKQTALATQILKENGFSLPFVEERRDIETAVSQAEKKLLLVWQRYDGSDHSRAAWQQAKQTFTEAIAKINKKILTFNLKAPSVQLHLRHIKAEERIREIQHTI